MCLLSFHIRALEVLFLLGYGAASVAECWCPTLRENIVVSSSEADIFRNITENTLNFEDETITSSLTTSSTREVVGT